MMAGHWGMTRTTIARCLVGAVVLLAAFALDGPAREARVPVVKAVPRWLLRSLAHGGDVVTLVALVGILLACGLVARQSRVVRAAVVLASALAGTALVVLSLKWLASRGPHGVFHGFGAAENGIMFPSGHTAWVIALGVAVSRATLIHFLSDVVAGAVIGAAVGHGVARWWAAQGFLELDYGSNTGTAPKPDCSSSQE